jgi:hypothetical protein
MRQLDATTMRGNVAVVTNTGRGPALLTSQPLR